MAKHEFGILQETPKPGVRYDVYAPEKYGCISVGDDLIEPMNRKLDTEMYWHTVDKTGKGLAYCGVTLIPPEAMDGMIGAMGDTEELAPLRELLMEAKQQDKFVIHYGL